MTEAFSEALRYLGVRTPDAEMLALVGEGFAALEAAPPRHCAQAFPFKAVEAAFESQALSEHLRGCEEAVLVAATLGVQADRLIRQAEATDTLRAAVLHACAAAKIEAYCDAVQATIAGADRSRFSPGYGDFPLSAQAKLLAMVGAEKRIGLYLTEGCMLVPAKSVTAVMGIGSSLENCSKSKCARCPKADCAFRG